MSKNESLLLGVSNVFTEETLEDILRKVTGERDVRVLSWNFEEASAKGDSYLSTVNKVLVEGRTGSEPVQVKLVIKSLPKNTGRRKTYRSTEFFYNEITFYNEVIPRFDEFLASKGQSHLLNVPRCLASALDGENDYLVLEDVGVYGFESIARQKIVDVKDCGLILETMAKFHAISFAYKDQKGEEYKKLASKLIETYFHDRLWNWYKKFYGHLIRVARDSLSREYPGCDAEKRFNSLEPRQLYERSIQICGRTSAPTSVITQGDSWAPNFLVRKSADGKDNALMLDFQLARSVSPVLDVAFFVYTCTDKALRDEHFDNLLAIYHKQLSEAITSLDSNPDELYPWNKFLDEVQEQFFFGMNFSLEAIPFCVLEDSEVFDLDLIKGDEAIDVGDIWNLQNLKKKEDRRRLADVIVHAFERGYL